MLLVIFFIYFILALTGYYFLRSFTKDSNFFRILPAGAIFASASYIFLLNLSTRFFPGKIGIYIATSILIIIAVAIKYKFNNYVTLLKRPDLLNSFFILLIYFVVISLSFLKMSTTLSAADSDMQWAYAASFSRGNNPLKVPWQADFNPSYHLGGPFFLGALNSLTNLPLRTLHTLNNFFYLTLGALLSIFLFYKQRAFLSNILLLNCLVIYLAFGVLIFSIPNFSLVNFDKLPLKFLPTIISRNEIPPKVDNSGGGIVDLDSLSFLPARSLGLAFCLLIIYFFLVEWRNNKAAVMSLILVVSTLALVEESIFLPLIITIFTTFLISFLPYGRSLKILRKKRKALFLILSTSILLSIIQGGFITEKIFAGDFSRFNFTLPFSSDGFINKLQRFNSFLINPGSSNTQLFNLFIPSPLLLLIFNFVIAIIKKNKVLLLIILFSLINFLLFLSIEDIFYTSNNVRFFNLGFIGAGFGFSYSIYLLLQQNNPKRNLVYMIMIPFLIFPTFRYEFSFHKKEIEEGIKNKLPAFLLTQHSSSLPIDLIAKWGGKYLPTNSRVLVIDKDFAVPSGSLSFQYNGLYTLFGPQFIPVNRPEPGIEYFDLGLSLNPGLFKQTLVEYLYIESESKIYKQLHLQRKRDLENPDYFDLLTSIEDKDGLGNIITYKLYKVRGMFLDSARGGREVSTGTLGTLQKFIPKGSTVFISDYPALSFWYRMATSLALKDRQLALRRRDQENISFRTPYTGYQLIETDFKIIDDKEDGIYDFYILPPGKSPPVKAELIWSNLFASAWKRL